MEWDVLKDQWRFNKAEQQEDRLMLWLLYLVEHAEKTHLKESCQIQDCRLCEAIPAVKAALVKWTESGGLHRGSSSYVSLIGPLKQPPG